MRRIGTTNNGGALIEMDGAEVQAIRQALQLLESITAEEPAAKAEDASAGRPRQVRARRTTDAGQGGNGSGHACTKCGVMKPVSEFYGRDRMCKACRLEQQRAYVQRKRKVEAATAKGLAVVKRVQARRAAAPREHDPALDRPVDASGRVMRVGASD